MNSAVAGQPQGVSQHFINCHGNYRSRIEGEVDIFLDT
jgi:hypothetical protein